jgi:hypothetical protein
LDEWLALFGVELDFVDDLKSVDTSELPQFYIVSGPSPRNPLTGHAVIFDRETKSMVHDPHYSGAGIGALVTSVRFLKQLPGREVHPCIPQSSFMPTPV